MSRLSEIWPPLERTALDAGVARIGAADLRVDNVELFEEWLAQGHHAGMRYLEKNAAIRRDPTLRFPWGRSVIVILVPYSGSRPQAPEGALSHHLSRYALGDDYHDVLERILESLEHEIGRLAPGTRTWRHVDTGPLSDRALAAQAGLGWIGRNSLLVTEEHGSYFFIGTLVTSLENDMQARRISDRCGTCTRCVDACPTAAILPDRTVVSADCISYATIEHRGPLASSMAAHLEGNAFGCDICQEACPWNRAPLDPHPAFVPRDSYRATPVTDLLRMQQADFSSLFAKSAVKRAKLAGMVRNVEALRS